MMHRPVLDLQKHLRTDAWRTLRITVLHITTYHALDDTFFAQVIHTLHQGLNGGTVTDNCHLVRTVNDLIELMCNDNGGKSLLFKGNQQIKQHLCVLIIQ